MTPPSHRFQGREGRTVRAARQTFGVSPPPASLGPPSPSYRRAQPTTLPSPLGRPAAPLLCHRSLPGPPPRFEHGHWLLPPFSCRRRALLPVQSRLCIQFSVQDSHPACALPARLPLLAPPWLALAPYHPACLLFLGSCRLDLTSRGPATTTPLGRPARTRRSAALTAVHFDGSHVLAAPAYSRLAPPTSATPCAPCPQPASGQRRAPGPRPRRYRPASLARPCPELQ